METGLTSVVTAICFLLSAFFAKYISAVPAAATAPALVLVGFLMIASFAEVQWDDITEAIPAFFSGIFMALTYSISYGIATGFIFYCLVKTVKKEARDVHPLLWIVSFLFILNFILLRFITQ